MASPDLLWAITRNTSSFLVKRSGAQFSTDPMNLRNKHSFKHSGVVNKKAVGVQAADKGVVLLTKSRKGSNANKPSKRVTKQTLARNVRRVCKSVRNETAGNFNRVDLTRDALVRATRILQSQKAPKVAVRRPRNRKTKKAAKAE